MKILSPTEVFGLQLNRTSVNDTDYNVRSQDVLVVWESATSNRYANLPAASVVTDGDEIVWLVDDHGLFSSSVTVTVRPHGTDKIAGKTELLLDKPYEAVCLKCNKVDGWSIIAINSATIESVDIVSALGFVPADTANPIFTGTIVAPSIFITGGTRQQVEVVNSTTVLTGNQSVVIVNSPNPADIHMPVGEENVVYRIRNMGPGLVLIKPAGTNTVEMGSQYELAAPNAVSLIFTANNWYIF
jgi:hypothetical protein